MVHDLHGPRSCFNSPTVADLCQVVAAIVQASALCPPPAVPGVVWVSCVRTETSAHCAALFSPKRCQTCLARMCVGRAWGPSWCEASCPRLYWPGIN